MTEQVRWADGGVLTIAYGRSISRYIDGEQIVLGGVLMGSKEPTKPESKKPKPPPPPPNKGYYNRDPLERVVVKK